MANVRNENWWFETISRYMLFHKQHHPRMVSSSEDNLSRLYLSLMVIDAYKVNAFGGCGDLFA